MAIIEKVLLFERLPHSVLSSYLNYYSCKKKVKYSSFLPLHAERKNVPLQLVITVEIQVQLEPI